MTNENYLDKDLILSLLSKIENTNLIDIDLNKYLKDIEIELNKIFKIINKKQLIERFIQFNPNAYEVLKSEKDLKKALSLILKSVIIYMKNYNDPLYIVAEISIVVDFLLYNGINLDL